MSNTKDTRTQILKATWALLEAHPGKNLSMSQIAKSAGVSRQALYLHFESRADLLIATTHYVDDVKGLEQRLAEVMQNTSSIEMLRHFIDVWCHYIPEIYSVSKALMISKESDEAFATAWKEIMGCMRDFCRGIIQALMDNASLSPHWTLNSATDYLYTLVSIQNWEQLTLECGWATDEVVSHTTYVATQALVTE